MQQPTNVALPKTGSREVVMVDGRVCDSGWIGSRSKPTSHVLRIEVDVNARWLGDAGSLATRQIVGIGRSLLCQARGIYPR